MFDNESAAVQKTGEDESDSRNQDLEEGRDYYLENGFMVFTAAFLKGRGYCCERGCRHCPYGYCPIK